LEVTEPVESLIQAFKV